MLISIRENKESCYQMLNNKNILITVTGSFGHTRKVGFE